MKRPSLSTVFFIALIVLAFCAGMYGHALYYDSQGGAYTFGDVFYGSLQLFSLNSGGIEPGKAPWILHAARLLAPLVTVYAVLITLTLMGKNHISLFALKEHVVICGFGFFGQILARHYQRQGVRLVIIDPVSSDVQDEQLRSCKAIRISGDAADPAILRKARVEHAQALAITCGNDAASLTVLATAAEYVRTAREGAALSCHVQLKILHSEAMNSLLTFINRQNPLLEVQPFDPDIAVAYKTLQEYPLDYAPLAASESARVQLVIVGGTHLGEVLALTAAHTAHYANALLPRIIFFNYPEEAEERFRVHYPYAEQAAEFIFAPAPLESSSGRSFLTELSLAPHALTTIAFCGDDASAALHLALSLPRELRGARPLSLVRISAADARPLTAVLASQAHALHVHPFGAYDVDLGMVMTVDALAQAIHEKYRENKIAEGAALDESAAPWPLLAFDYKQSNRLQALHLPVKVRAAGCVLAEKKHASGQESTSFSVEEIEILARMEHNRWVAERSLAGWRHAPERDNEHFLHPDLKPYEELNEETKEYDRAAVRLIPELAQRAGLVIARS